MQSSDIDGLEAPEVKGLAIQLAKLTADGHLSVFRFSTGYKAVLGTPDIVGADRERIFRLRSSATEDGALRDLLHRELLRDRKLESADEAFGRTYPQTWLRLHSEQGSNAQSVG